MCMSVFVLLFMRFGHDVSPSRTANFSLYNNDCPRIDCGNCSMALSLELRNKRYSGSRWKLLQKMNYSCIFVTYLNIVAMCTSRDGNSKCFHCLPFSQNTAWMELDKIKRGYGNTCLTLCLIVSEGAPSIGYMWCALWKHSHNIAIEPIH